MTPAVSPGPLLVTGGGGQLGRAFSAGFPGAVVLSRSELDVTDAAAIARVFDRVRPVVVINAAAYTAVDAAESHPDDAFVLNAAAPGLVAAAAERSGALMVQVSTDYVYEGSKVQPYVEDDPTGPLSVYGKSKLAGEQAVWDACSRWLIVRTSWVFGEGKNFIASILRAAQTRDVLSVVDDQTGLPTYAPDLAGGIMGLVQAGADGIFHLAGGGRPGTWADVAEAALKAAGSAAKVERITTREYFANASGPVAPRPANSVLDCTKAADLGVALRAWPRSIAAYVKASPDKSV